MLETLFNPSSDLNFAQVNDTTLNTMMASALDTTDYVARNKMYKDIQYYIALHYFHIPIYHSKIVSAHLSNIHRVPYNAMGALRIYPMYRGLFEPLNPMD